MVTDIPGHAVYSFDNRYSVYSFDECLKRRISSFPETSLNWTTSALARHILISGNLTRMFYLSYNPLLFQT